MDADGRAAYKRAWYLANRARILAAQKTPEKRALRAQRQNEYRARNPEKAKAAVRATRARHIERYRVKERAKYTRISTKNWPAKCGTETKYRKGCRCEECKYAMKIHRHRRNRGYRPTAAQLQARINYYGRACWMCRKPFECIDHVIPLHKGGTNHPANLRPACTSCNSRKRDLHYSQFG